MTYLETVRSVAFAFSFNEEFHGLKITWTDKEGDDKELCLTTEQLIENLYAVYEWIKELIMYLYDTTTHLIGLAFNGIKNSFLIALGSFEAFRAWIMSFFSKKDDSDTTTPAAAA